MHGWFLASGILAALHFSDHHDSIGRSRTGMGGGGREQWPACGWVSRIRARTFLSDEINGSQPAAPAFGGSALFQPTLSADLSIGRASRPHSLFSFIMFRLPAACRALSYVGGTANARGTVRFWRVAQCRLQSSGKDFTLKLVKLFYFPLGQYQTRGM